MADGVEERTYSAKQVATRIGTDAKQLRKFFRDNKSGYTPVGQGGRYDFPESEIPKIKTAFDQWNSTKTKRNRSPQKKLTTGLVPQPRREKPGTETLPKNRPMSPTAMMKAGLHGNALDNDTLQDRMKGIGARVREHNLVARGGRLVPGPRKPDQPIPHSPIESIQGVTKPGIRELDFRDEEDIEQDEAKLDRLFFEALEGKGGPELEDDFMEEI